MHNWSQLETVCGAHVLYHCLFNYFRLNIVVIRAVYAFVISKLYLSFFHRDFNHSDDEVSLPRH